MPRYLSGRSSGGGYELYSSNNDDDNTNTNNNTNGGGRMPFRDVGSNVFDQDYSDDEDVDKLNANERASRFRRRERRRVRLEDVLEVCRSGDF